MRKNKKQRKVLMLLLILLGLTIGFALLSVTLKINGTAGIKSNRWDIHWENIQPNNESTVTAEIPEITENKTKVTYSVELSLPGDFYEFTVDAKNDGSINGEITKIDHNVYQVVNGEAETEATTLPSYIKYSIVYDGTESTPAEGDILEAGEKQTYRIRIEYDSESSTLPDTDLTYKIEDEITYTQTKKAEEKTGIALKKDNTTNEPTFGCGTLGDEFCIGDECFNMVSCDNNTAVLLAKYNLLVGSTCTERNNCTTITSDTEGYGIQSITAKGEGPYGESSQFPAVGVINYSATNYWKGNVGPDKTYKGATVTEEGYCPDDPGCVEYYSNEIYVYDENSNLYQPIENYVSYLKTIGADRSTTGRILNVSEMIDIFECHSGSCHKIEEDPVKYNFMANTSFWVGVTNIGASVTYDSVYGSIFAINRYKNYNTDYDVDEVITPYFTSAAGSYGALYGIRPVIEIPTSSIAYDWWRLEDKNVPLTSQKWQYWENGKKLIEGWYRLDDFYGGKAWFYFEDGNAKTGWHEENGNKYYLSTSDDDGNGYLNCNRLENTTKEIDGVSYTFDENGVCTNCS